MATNITDPIFHDEAKALAHIEASRWNGTPHCGHCGSVRGRRLEGKMVGYFQCNDCREKFTVRTGSIMERSHVPLHKWLLAFHLMAASKKDMSAKQMERMLGVTYKTAWFLCHRIREAMDGACGDAPLGGPDMVVEADEETYVGGKAHNRAHRQVKPKKAVVALVARDGHARSFHVANVNAKTLRPLVVTYVDRRSHLVTDDSHLYTGVGYEYNGHSTVNHSKKEYVAKGGFMHSNTVENFFSIFKRGVIGTYTT
jgi:transposase-like protein